MDLTFSEIIQKILRGIIIVAVVCIGLSFIFETIIRFCSIGKEINMAGLTIACLFPTLLTFLFNIENIVLFIHCIIPAVVGIYFLKYASEVVDSESYGLITFCAIAAIVVLCFFGYKRLGDDFNGDFGLFVQGKLFTIVVPVCLLGVVTISSGINFEIDSLGY